jgi:hypothetical protein
MLISRGVLSQQQHRRANFTAQIQRRQRLESAARVYQRLVPEHRPPEAIPALGDASWDPKSARCVARSVPSIGRNPCHRSESGLFALWRSCASRRFPAVRQGNSPACITGRVSSLETMNRDVASDYRSGSPHRLNTIFTAGNRLVYSRLVDVHTLIRLAPHARDGGNSWAKTSRTSLANDCARHWQRRRHRHRDGRIAGRS